MSDVLTRDQRHKNMQHIHGKDTKAELVLRKTLWNHGYRYRKNWKALPGKPDIVLTKYRICIFVDSEFFHGKGFDGDYDSRKYSSLREQLSHSTNSEFWLQKIQDNIQRDRKADAELTGLGWTVLHFWSRDVLKNPEDCVKAIDEAIFRFMIDK